jgi:hypothetical protein
VPKERGVAARQKGDRPNYEKQPVFPFACFHTKYLMPYGAGTLTVWRWASHVTAAQVGPEVNNLPSTVTPTVVTEIAVAANTFPLKDGAESVAELPTTQKTFFAWALFMRRILPRPDVVKLLGA